MRYETLHDPMLLGMSRESDHKDNKGFKQLRATRVPMLLLSFLNTIFSYYQKISDILIVIMTRYIINGCSRKIVFFLQFLYHILPPLPRQHRAAIVHSEYCVENFEPLLQRYVGEGWMKWIVPAMS